MRSDDGWHRGGTRRAHVHHIQGARNPPLPAAQGAALERTHTRVCQASIGTGLLSVSWKIYAYKIIVGYTDRPSSLHAELCQSNNNHHQSVAVHCWTWTSLISCQLTRFSKSLIQLLPTSHPTKIVAPASQRSSVLRPIRPAPCHFSLLVWSFHPVGIPRRRFLE